PRLPLRAAVLHPVRRGLSHRLAEIEIDDVERQVDAGREAAGREDARIAPHETKPAPDVDLRKGPGELVVVAVVRRRRLSIEETGRGEPEGSRADGHDH